MYTTEIVERKPQCVSVTDVRPLLAERVGEPCHTLQAEQSAIYGQAHVPERPERRFCEGTRALATAKALMTSFTLAESFAFGLAVVARHFEP